jgi:hypothetical protein
MRRVEPPPWTGLHRLGLTGLVVLAATALPAIVHLVAPGADPGRIGLGIAGAERPIASRQSGGGRPLASCDNSYCPALH